MTNPLLELPGTALGRLKDALSMGMVRAPYASVAIRSNVGQDLADTVLAGLQKLDSQGIRDRGVVAWLDAIEAARADIPRPALVWTGPEVEGLHARDTRQVFEELIGRAEKSLWISTYAYFDGKKAFEVLADRMDAVPTLRVNLLLNIERREEHASASQAVEIAAKRLWKHNWGGQRRPRVYYFPESLVKDPGERGVLHAKAIVRDECEVLITSANFTEAALNRNIELGVLIHDGHFARQVARHYERLIEREKLVEVPRC